MSGGSYSYLYCSGDNDLDFLIERQTELEQMCVRLENLPESSLAEADSKWVLKSIRDLQNHECHQKGLILAKVKQLIDVWRAVEYFDSNDVAIDDVTRAIDNFNQHYTLLSDPPKDISLFDLLWEYNWLAEMIPQLSFQVRELVIRESDFELARLEQYVANICVLLPQVIDSFSTSEDLPRQTAVVTNCFSIRSFSHSSTVRLLTLMANNFDTGVYDLCDRISQSNLDKEQIDENDRLRIAYLQREGLIITVTSEGSRSYELSELGKELVALWQ